MSTKTTDLVYAGASLRERQDYAIALSAAGELIPKGLRDANGQPNAGKILLVTEYGNALGIHPIVAINGIDIIEGNLTITPALMSGLVREAGHKLRITTQGTGQGLTARAVLIRADDPAHPFDVTWTMADAKAAGLDGKTNWKRYPRAMLKARAISEVCREGAEDVLMGAYTPEELGAVVNEAGEIIDGEIVEDEPGPRHTGKRGHANETQVSTASDRQPTPGSGPRPSPSRTVTSPGAGRATPPPEPSEEQAAAVADYVERIAAEDDIERLRDLHGDASAHGLLAAPTGDGRRLNDVFYQRREAILQAQEMPPALDGIEDDA